MEKYSNHDEVKNESNKGSKSMQSIIVGIDESYYIYEVT